MPFEFWINRLIIFYLFFTFAEQSVHGTFVPQQLSSEGLGSERCWL